MGTEHRKDPRVPGYAKAVFVEGQIPGYIRDLSRSGCQVSFMQPVPAAVGDLITVQIIAEHDPSIGPFRVRLRVRHVIEDALWYSVGTEIETIFDPKEAKAFDALVSYYSANTGER
ncbi:MAG: PilZ domain-containing protein [Spirochaetia bacterium]